MLVLQDVKRLVDVLTAFKGTYVKLLINVTLFCYQRGVAGDILLTIFALAWMLWPLYIPIHLEKNGLYIPCGVGAAILSIVGYPFLISPTITLNPPY